MRLSFEYFPPRTARGETALLETARRLETFRPEFSSVTCGAGGSTDAERPPWRSTLATLRQLRANRLNAVPHLTIREDSEAGTKEALDHYLAEGASRLVALRGDAPGAGAGLTQSAETLVQRIRRHSADAFEIEVAGYPEVHPQAASPAADIENLKRKVDAGADGVITQYFYNLSAFLHFRDRARRAGVEAPITPGIMPLVSFSRILRFSAACGADIPRWIRQHLEALRNDQDALVEFGVEVVSRLCADLLAAGVPGLHFYTLNQWRATAAICRNLGL